MHKCPATAGRLFENKKMSIATHNPKAFWPRMKQAPVSARLKGIPEYLLCSEHVQGAELFAAPSNAADMPKARAEAESSDFCTAIPDLQDGRLKQILLPWQGDYVAVTPLPSGKVMAEVHERATKLQASPKLWAHMRLIQPVAAAANNHGDPIARKGGRSLLVSQHIYPLSGPVADTPAYQFDCHGIMLVADITGLQISSNYVQAGLPAITAIGGAVHVVERATGLDLPFAVAITPFEDWQEGKITSRAKLNGKRATAAKDMITEEITANTRIYLLVQCDQQHHLAIASALLSLNRIAGGTVWNAQTHVIRPDTQQPPMRWIMPARITAQAECDLLDTFLDIRRRRPVQMGIVQTGFAFLHEPHTTQAMARSDSKLHAWVEPIFSMANLDMPLTLEGFWYRREQHNLVWWNYE